MLPPGHVAGGYLTAAIFLKLTGPALTSHQVQQLLLMGAFFGFAPDLDMFYAFKKVKGFTIPKDKISHRTFYSHAPLVWLVLGLSISFFATTTFMRYVGLIVWLGAWSHFVLDSIEYGIMWLWPLNRKLYALKDRAIASNIPDTRFWSYWFIFLKWYSKRTSFYLELLIMFIAITTFLYFK